AGEGKAQGQQNDSQEDDKISARDLSHRDFLRKHEDSMKIGVGYFFIGLCALFGMASFGPLIE
ncbi:MAG TPA: hypothetical protein VN843_14325, partial [Anaerolineales bacterium]|nr:hypothetical protein [Anaerolineales bacterium]